MQQEDGERQSRFESIEVFASRCFSFGKFDFKLDNSIVNRYLSIADDEFVWSVDQDVREFVQKTNQKR